jgi:predicted ArsR family transcriptional regulator
MKLTPTNLLSRMRRGHDYTATDLAERFSEPTTTVRDMLCTLVEEGRVEMSSKSSRMMRFRLAEARVAASQSDQGGGEAAVTSVATFPVTRTLNGSLCGYDSTLTRHRALAMLARDSGK